MSVEPWPGRLQFFSWPLRIVDPEGVVDISDDLRVERLVESYRLGVFPWPVPGYPTLWFCPPRRGVLDLADWRVPKSLRKARRRNSFTYTVDRCFADVVKACRHTPRRGEAGTWITPLLEEAYQRLHLAGHAHSFEVWDNERLVGGVYGVSIDGVFSGESMFHVVSDASKLALWHLIEWLQERGATWMDTQMVTPVVEQLGGKWISREEHWARLRLARGHFFSGNPVI
jgi:leucyl/phenylalanyl-tRNA---protein transferase